MNNIKDSPGVFFPPPLIYAGFFLLSFLLQGFFTIKRAFFFHNIAANIIGIIIIILRADCIWHFLPCVCFLKQRIR